MSIIANAFDSGASILNYGTIDLLPIDKLIKLHEEKMAEGKDAEGKGGGDGEIGAVVEK